MLLSLLLQVRTTIERSDLNGVYVALGATVLAALIAAAASVLATLKTTATSREVANLLARSAQELTEKAYKNEYFKKLLDRRLQAIDYAQVLVNLFLPFKQSDASGLYHTYFVTKLNTKRFETAIGNVVANAIWMNNETMDAIQAFNREVGHVLDAARQEADEPARLALCASKFETIRAKRKAIALSIGKDIRDLYDIDAFLLSGPHQLSPPAA